MGIDQCTAASIARREAVEAELKDTVRDAVRTLRAYVRTLDDERRDGLNRIIDYAEATGNYYTVLYVLQAVEEDMVSLRKKLSRLIYEATEQQNNEKGENDD